jgi:hypothetical protein
VPVLLALALVLALEVALALASGKCKSGPRFVQNFGNDLQPVSN